MGTAGIALALAAFGGMSLAAKRFLPQSESGPLRVVGRTSLSPKHSVYLLKAGDRVLIVGTGPRARRRSSARCRPRPRDRRRDSPDSGSGVNHDRPRRPPSARPRPLLRSTADASPDGPKSRANAPVAVDAEVDRAAAVTPSTPALPKLPAGADVWKSVQTIGLFAAVSLAPAAILMLTSFVRIQIVLVLLRQALGSPQVPGNQVLTALALLLTLLVMKPVGDVVYGDAVAPLMAEPRGSPRRRRGRPARGRSGGSWSTRSSGRATSITSPTCMTTPSPLRPTASSRPTATTTPSR